MSRINDLFETTLEKRSRIMARDYGINVVIQGSGAYTDGKTIFLPMLEDVPEEVMADLDGFADHEIAHCRFSDFDVLKQLSNRWHKEAVNAIEDSRIEILMVNDYPGCKLSLDRLNRKWRAISEKSRIEQTADGKFVLPWPIRIILCIREIYDNRPVKMDDQIEPIMVKIWSDCEALRDCVTTGELLVAMEAIRVKINKIREDMFSGDYQLDDEELDSAMSCGYETPIELDPNRKERKSKIAEGAETYDPAVEKTEGGEGDDIGESESEEKSDSDEKGESANKEKSDKSDAKPEEADEGDSDMDGDSGDSKSEADKDSDGDGDSDESGKSDAEQSEDSGKNESKGEEKSDAESGEKENTSSNNKASLSAEQDGEEKGAGGTAMNEAEDEDNSDGDESESGSSIDEESDEDDANADDTKSDTPSSLDGEDEEQKPHNSEVSDAQKEARKQAAKSLEQEKSNTKRESEEQTKRHYAEQIKERVEKQASEFEESEVENEMLNEAENAEESEYDKHVFSSESFMQIELEKAILKDVESRDYTHAYDSGGVDEKMVSLPFSRDFDEIIDYTGQGDATEYAERRRQVLPHVNPIKLRLERMLKVIENKQVRFERERGLLNGRALARVATDKDYRTPFKDLTKTETRDVAVTLLIDCSGSMAGDKIELARQTGLALAESLKAIQIPFECLGFNTTGSPALQQAVADSGLPYEALQRFGRMHTALRLMVFKAFGSQDLSGICLAESGGANADGESLIWAAKRLAQRPEKRKILIVLSDGQPACEGDGWVLAGDLKRVVKLITKAKMEPIGIGIMCDSPKQFYPNWVKVSDLKSLPTVVMGKLAGMLTDGLKRL